MNRESSLRKLTEAADRNEVWDIAIIGGGATGVGTAVDAASRGYKVCLLEQSDFGKGTSSRSTKLVHGGVRYLQQGNISLVKEALHERELLQKNAAHLVHALPFIVPTYAWWESPFYGTGLRIYDLLAGSSSFGHSRLLSKEEVLLHIPTLEQEGLRGGVLYYDGQFDDARLLIDLAQTADQQGAVLLNYAPVLSLTRNPDGMIHGLTFRDVETGHEYALQARCVINATGAFADTIRKMDDPHTPEMIAPSQGTHIVLDRSFLPGDAAIMVPRTTDGRVMFAIPWHNRTLLGTTDTPVQAAPLEPIPQHDEIDFILQTAGRYLHKHPTRSDILSTFAGIRPLVKASSTARTAALSRDHTIHISDAGLLTIAGGKWTTYRRMAEDCVDHAAQLAKLEPRRCQTKTLPIHGSPTTSHDFGILRDYGSTASAVLALTEQDPSLNNQLCPTLPMIAAQVIWAARNEMAHTIEDILARRTRTLLLDARAAIAMAAEVARLMSQELHLDAAWQQTQIAAFTKLAQNYLISG